MRRWDPVELPERAFAQPFETPDHSLPDGQITVGAGIGHERNGVFFS